MPARTMLLALLFAVGCGGDDGPIGSCDTRTQGDMAELGLCRTWGGERTAPTSEFQNLCESNLGGVFSGGECPLASTVGSCDTDQGFGLQLTYYYYDTDFDAQTAQAHCESRPSCSFACTFVPSP